MKTLILLLTLLPLTQNSDTTMLETYLRELSTAAVNKDEAALKPLVYPLVAGGDNYQENLIAMIIEDNESSSGDGAFTNKALQVLIKHHVDKFTPVSKALYQDLSRDPDFKPVLADMALEDIIIFDHKKVHILLVKKEGRLQLLFWEDLNNLLQ